MTRQDILTMGRDMLREVPGSQQAAFPQGWSKIISQSADEIARRTDAFYTTVNTPIVSGQAQYCAPQIYKARAVSVYTPDGNRHTVLSSTIAAMDDNYSPWRDQTAQSCVGVWIPVGLNQLILNPVPIWSSTQYVYGDLVVQAGNSLQVTSVGRPFSVLTDVNQFVQVSAPSAAWSSVTTYGAGASVLGGDGNGYTSLAGGNLNHNPVGDGGAHWSAYAWTPGFYRILSVAGVIATLASSPATVSSVGGAGQLTSGGLNIEGYATFGTGSSPLAWDAMSAACPLPDRAHYAVVLKACLLRIMQDPSKDNLLRRPMIDAEFKTEIGELEAEVRRYAVATREPSYVGGADGGWGGASGFNPLDM